MKRVMILVFPLVLFVGFLAIKPPAIGADAEPTSSTSPQANQDPTSPNSAQPSTPGAGNSVAPTAKPSISGGDDDDDDNDQDDEDDEEDEKPRYGGHDDDDYDD
jgi:hypothetical protein